MILEVYEIIFKYFNALYRKCHLSYILFAVFDKKFILRIKALNNTSIYY